MGNVCAGASLSGNIEQRVFFLGAKERRPRGVTLVKGFITQAYETVIMISS